MCASCLDLTHPSRTEFRNGECSNGRIFQAAEREVIILSLIWLTEEFILSDFKRRVCLFNQPKITNVALTRVSNLLIVVGNPLMMENGIIWRDWLIFAAKMDFGKVRM